MITIVWLALQPHLCFNSKSNYLSKFWMNESFSFTLTYHQLFPAQLPCKLFIPLRLLLYSRPLGKPRLKMGMRRKASYRFGIDFLCVLLQTIGLICKIENLIKVIVWGKIIVIFIQMKLFKQFKQLMDAVYYTRYNNIQ